MERVQQWLQGLAAAFAQYKQKIEDNSIDGHVLVHGLTSADKWAEAGVTNTLHQLALAKKRAELLGKSQPTAPTQAAAASDSSTIDAAEIRLASRLGAGHFGEAWLASFRGADVVVKRLNAAPSISDEKARVLHCSCSAWQHHWNCAPRVQAFVSEVAILSAACRHPHVIGYLGVARHGKELWSVADS